ncbi:MAG TPA: tetratricopeptide repeat protein [bacterium]|nr:tetratricopeptide repeat protein [bacterium]
MHRTITFIFLLLLFFSSLLSFAQDQPSIDPAFEAGKTAYFANDYAQAVVQFEKVLRDHPDNGYAQYNLGNAFFKLGELGKARLYYEKAVLRLPRFQDLQINSDLLKQKLTDAVEKSFGDYLSGTFYFWIGYLTMSEGRILVILLSIGLWGYCVFRILRRQQLVVTSTAIVLLIFVYLSLGCFIKYHLEKPLAYGVILPKSSDVRASYQEKDQVLFTLHEGAKVRLIDHQDFGDAEKWVKISLPQGQKGWVKAQEVGEI